jgi:hypothetical protein
MQSHARVRHPNEILKQAKTAKFAGRNFYRLNDRFLGWVTNHVLASVVLFDIALVLPLLAIPASNSVKITLGVVSGSWIQWWALPALQRSQNKIQAQNDAKAEVDHETLTYLATSQDEHTEQLKQIIQQLKDIK